MSYRKAIKTGGFDKESDDIYTWGGNPDNEFVPNERINSFVQSRLLRAERYEKMPISTEQYAKFVRELYAGFGEFNPFADVTRGDIAEYIIENSGLKDIIWSHLVELFNCITELNEIVQKRALMYCNHLSTTGLDLDNNKLDTIIRDPQKLQHMINQIVDFINCTNTKDVNFKLYKHIKPFEGELLDYEKTLNKPHNSNIAEMKEWVKILLDEEIKISKHLRDLEKYHSYVIIESDKLFEKCNSLRTALNGGT